MNRLIVKYGYPLTAAVLALFGWVVLQRISRGWSEVLPLAVTGVIVWAAGAPVFICLWPRLTVGGFKRAIVRRGFGWARMPVNTLEGGASGSVAVGSGASP